jgi:hypothetical protein
MSSEWIKRGFKDNMYENIRFELQKYPSNITIPSLLGYEPYHASHRSNLLRKDKVFYGKYGWKESNDLPYIWTV